MPITKEERIKNLKPWKKGQSGNPSGVTALPRDVLEAKKTNRVSLERTLNEFLMLNRLELQKRLQNQSATMLELAVGTIVAKAAKDGDQIRLNFILDRLIGKVKDQVKVEIEHKPTIIIGIDGAPDIHLGMEQLKITGAENE